MDMDYDWRFTPPGEHLAVHMISRRQGREIFNASLYLQQQPLTGGTLARTLLRWPFMTAKVIAAIYWQALRLKWKGVPFCPTRNNLTSRKDATVDEPKRTDLFIMSTNLSLIHI